MSFKRKKIIEKKDNLIEDSSNNNNNDSKKEIEEINRIRLKNLIIFIKKINEQINSNKELISRYQQIKKMTFLNKIMLKGIRV